MLDTFLPQRNGIANAFDFIDGRRSIDAKYGDAIGDVKEMHMEIEKILESLSKSEKNEKAAAV